MPAPKVSRSGKAVEGTSPSLSVDDLENSLDPLVLPSRNLESTTAPYSLSGRLKQLPSVMWNEGIRSSHDKGEETSGCKSGGSVLLLGKTTTTVRAPLPLLLPDKGATNALFETWQSFHGNSDLHWQNSNLQHTVSEEIRKYVHCLGLSTELHNDLGSTLAELAKRTLVLLKARQAPLTEAEYLYIAAETLSAWSQQTSDKLGLEKLKESPGRVLHEALEYHYRKVMGDAYMKVAVRVVPELLTASGDSKRREEIWQKSLKFGDPEVLKKVILDVERQRLQEKRSAIQASIQAEVLDRYQKALPSFTEVRDLNDLNAILERILQDLQNDKVVQQKLQAFTKEVSASERDRQGLWAGLVQQFDSRREMQAHPVTPEVLLQEGMKAAGTVLILQHLERVFTNNRETDISKRYGEWNILIEAKLRDLTGGDRDAVNKIEKEIARFSNPDKIKMRLNELIERRDHTLEVSRILSTTHHLAFEFTPLSKQLENDLYGALKQATIAKNATKDTKLTSTQIAEIISALGGGVGLKATIVQHPGILQSIERYFHIRGIDTSELRSELHKQLRLNNRQFREDLQLAHRAEDPVTAIWKLTRLASSALSAEDYQSLVDTTHVTAQTHPLINACLHGAIPQPITIDEHQLRQIAALSSEPGKLKALLFELKAEILHDERKLRVALQACKRAGLDDLACTFIEEHHKGLRSPAPEILLQSDRDQRREELRRTLLPKGEGSERKLGRNGTWSVEQRQRHLNQLWENLQLESETKTTLAGKSIEIPKDCPKEMSDVHRLTEEVRRPVAEIISLAKKWSKAIPCTNSEGLSGWEKDYRDLVIAEYRARVEPLYQKIIEAEKKYGTIVDLKRVLQAEESALQARVLPSSFSQKLASYSPVQVSQSGGQTENLTTQEASDKQELEKIGSLTNQIVSYEAELIFAAKCKANEPEQEKVTKEKLAQLYRQLQEVSKQTDLIDYACCHRRCREIAQHIAEENYRSLSSQQQKLSELTDIVSRSDKPFAELYRELRNHSAGNKLTPTQIKELVVGIRGKGSHQELCRLQYEKGYISSLSKIYGNAEATRRLVEIEKRVPELHQQLERAIADFPEVFDEDYLTSEHRRHFSQGIRSWNHKLEEIQEKTKLDAVVREREKNTLDRTEDILTQAAQNLGKFEHTVEMIVGGTMAQSAGFVRGLISFENPFSHASDYGADYIAWSHKKQNKYLFSTSAFGSDEELAKSSLWKLALNMHSFSHLGDFSISPLLNMSELAFDETMRAVYNSTNSTPLDYSNFQQLLKTDPILKNAKRAFHTTEVGASLLLIVGSGGIGGASMATRLARAGRALGIAGSISAVSATGEELLAHDLEDFRIERVFDNTLRNTAHSLMFSAGLHSASSLYVRAGMGRSMPKSSAELKALKISEPAKFEKIERLVREAQWIAHVVDALDSQGDLVDAFAQLDRVENTQQLVGAMFLIGAATFDVLDGRPSGKRKALATPTKAEIARETYRSLTGENTWQSKFVKTSADGVTLRVGDISVLREMYTESRFAELQTAPNLKDVRPENLMLQARKEAENVQAFADKVRGVAVVYDGLLKNASVFEKIVSASWVVHENMHLKGHGEHRAWREQLDFIHETAQRLGLNIQIELKQGRIAETRLKAGQTARKVSNSEIEAHIVKLYPGNLSPRNAIAAGLEQKDERGPEEHHAIVDKALGRLSKLADNPSIPDALQEINALVSRRILMTEKQASQLREIILLWEIENTFAAEPLVEIKRAADPYTPFDRESKQQHWKREIRSFNSNPSDFTKAVRADWFEDNIRYLADLHSETYPSLVREETVLSRLYRQRGYWAKKLIESSPGAEQILSVPMEVRLDDLLAIADGKREGPKACSLIIEDWWFSELKFPERVRLLSSLSAVNHIELPFESLCVLCKGMSQEEEGQLWSELYKVQSIAIAGDWRIFPPGPYEGVVRFLQNMEGPASLGLDWIDLSRLTVELDSNEILKLFRRWSSLNCLSLHNAKLEQILELMSAERRVLVFELLGNIPRLSLGGESYLLSPIGMTSKQRVCAIRQLSKCSELSLDGTNLSRLMDGLTGSEKLLCLEALTNKGELCLSRSEIGNLLDGMSSDYKMKAFRYLGAPNTLVLTDNSLNQAIDSLKPGEMTDALGFLGKVSDLWLGEPLICRSMGRQILAFEALAKSGQLSLSLENISELYPSTSDERLKLFQALAGAYSLDLRYGSHIGRIFSAMNDKDIVKAFQSFANLDQLSLDLSELETVLSLGRLDTNQRLSIIESLSKLKGLRVNNGDFYGLFAGMSAEQKMKGLMKLSNIHKITIEQEFHKFESLESAAREGTRRLLPAQMSIIANTWLRKGHHNPFRFFSSPALDFANEQDIKLAGQDIRVSKNAKSIFVRDLNLYTRLYKDHLRRETPHLSQEEIESLGKIDSGRPFQFIDSKSKAVIILDKSNTCEPPLAGRLRNYSQSTLPDTWSSIPSTERISSNRRALFLSQPEKIRELYVSRTLDEIKRGSHNTSKSEELLLEEVTRASRGVVAFYDPKDKQMVLPQVKPSPLLANPSEREQARLQRVLAASWAVHEYAHYRGKSEFEAWRLQMDYLHRALNSRPSAVQDRELLHRNYQISLANEGISIQEAQMPHPVSDQAIRHYLQEAYGPFSGLSPVRSTMPAEAQGNSSQPSSSYDAKDNLRSLVLPPVRASAVLQMLAGGVDEDTGRSLRHPR